MTQYPVFNTKGCNEEKVTAFRTENVTLLKRDPH